MNWNLIEENWESLQDKVRETWNALNDHDLKVIEGRRERLAGRLQVHYGFDRNEAERQLQEFEALANSWGGGWNSERGQEPDLVTPGPGGGLGQNRIHPLVSGNSESRSNRAALDGRNDARSPREETRLILP